MTWRFLIFYGVVMSFAVVWFAAQDWPAGRVALPVLIFPALAILVGLVLRHRERAMKPKLEAYFAANDGARQELRRARIIEWTAIAGVVLAALALSLLEPLNYVPSETLALIAVGVLAVAVLTAMLYRSIVQQRIEEAASRLSSGLPPAAPEAQRSQTVWVIAIIGVALGVVALDRFVDLPVSPVAVLFFGGLACAVLVPLWLRFNPPRGPQ